MIQPSTQFSHFSAASPSLASPLQIPAGRSAASFPGASVQSGKSARDAKSKSAHKKEYDPFTDTLLRYTGYLNEAGESFKDPMHQLFTRINPKQLGGLAKSVVDATYTAVFAYTIADATYMGTKTYMDAKQKGDKKALPKAIQAGAGQGIFQLIASYYVPAEIIKHIINPVGQKLGGVAHKAAKLKTPVGGAKLAAGTALSMASIPVLVKIVDPIAHWTVENLWQRPTSALIDKTQ
jgi:hypothetical protein